jgi:hypothetical protein
MEMVLVVMPLCEKYTAPCYTLHPAALITGCTGDAIHPRYGTTGGALLSDWVKARTFVAEGLLHC